MIEYFMKHGQPGQAPQSFNSVEFGQLARGITGEEMRRGMKTEECQDDDEYDGDDDDDKDNDYKESNTRSLTRSRLALG